MNQWKKTILQISMFVIINILEIIVGAIVENFTHKW